MTQYWTAERMMAHLPLVYRQRDAEAAERLGLLSGNRKVEHSVLRVVRDRPPGFSISPPGCGAVHHVFLDRARDDVATA